MRTSLIFFQGIVTLQSVCDAFSGPLDSIHYFVTTIVHSCAKYLMDAEKKVVHLIALGASSDADVEVAALIVHEED